MSELSSDDLDSIDPNLQLRVPESVPQMWLEVDVRTNRGPVSQNESQIAEIQILLDRAGFSPGVINGVVSEHFFRVLDLYQNAHQLAEHGIGPALIEQMSVKTDGNVFEDYTITREDIAGPFVAAIPERIQDQGELKRLHYMRVSESIGERFHMDENFLIRLNPQADFQKAGTVVKVANIGKPVDIRVSRIVADKARRLVTAFNARGELVAAYPASIGSVQNPSPHGDFAVRNKAENPAYTLAPDNGFEEVEGNRQIIVAPGPNNPVGIAWIGLSKKTFGIHGTPEPSHVGRSASNGCIRLTNWDALELAKLVTTGVEVSIR